MEYQFFPSRCWDHLSRIAARTNLIDLALLALLIAFGVTMCLTLTVDV